MPDDASNRCPACARTTVLELETSTGDLICPSCRGRFLGRDRVEQAVVTEGGISRESLLMLAELCGGENLPCPGCNQETTRLQLRGQWLDVCFACGGMWFDAGEYESMTDPGGKPDSGSSAPAVVCQSESTQDQPVVPLGSHLRNEIAPLIEELELTRKQLHDLQRRRMTHGFLLAAAGLLLSLVVFKAAGFTLADSSNPGRLVILLCLAYLVGVIVWVSAPGRIYKAAYSDQIMPKLVSLFGDLHYSAEYTLSEELEKFAILGQYTRERSKGEDNIFGKYRGVKLDLVEAHLWYRSGQDSKIVFQGLLVLLTTNRQLRARTIIVAKPTLGRMFAKRFSPTDRVGMDDPPFDKVARVYSSDHDEARSVLTPSLRARLLQVNKLLAGRELRYSFVGNELLITISHDSSTTNMFEAGNLSKSTTEHVKTVTKDIQQVLRIVDVLRPEISTPA